MPFPASASSTQYSGADIPFPGTANSTSTEEILAWATALIKNVETLLPSISKVVVFRQAVASNVEKIINKLANMEIQAADTRSKVDDLTTRMVLMGKRKIIVEKQPADTHQVPRKTFAAAVADGLPPMPIFQEAVNRNATGNGKQPGNANQPNKPPAPYPRTAREVVITFANNKTLQTGNEIESRALELVNDAMQQSSLKRRPFFASRFSLSSNLILTTGLYDSNEDFAEHLGIIEKAAEFIGPATATLPIPWTKFLRSNMHGS
jgi:hypothetical protein